MVIIACLLTPLVWNGIEMYNVGQAFTLAESLFYGVNIPSIGTEAGQLLIMGVCDFFCRLNQGRAGRGDTRVLTLFGFRLSLGDPGILSRAGMGRRGRVALPADRPLQEYLFPAS